METVTFLFLDIEGSTRLLHLLGNRYADVLADYRRLVRGIVRDRGGTEIGTAGDSIFNVFADAAAAVASALGAQRAIVEHAWPEGASVRVRMGLHTGEPHVVGGEYVGLDVHRAARVCSAGQGGQILLSQTTHDLAARGLPPGATVRDLGGHRLKDLQRPERIFKLLHPDLPRDVPRLNSLDALRHNLPIHLTSFIGRDREMAEVKRLLAAARLVTLTGVGGCGKTRLACQVAADMPDQFPDGVWLVELAPLSDPALIPQALTSALGVREEPQRPLTDTVVDYLRSTQTLLVMDNCEHLVAASAHLSERLLQACAGLRILATSREPLGIAGEVAWTVPSLASPNPQQLPPVENLAQYPAIRLFIERAVAALPTFRVTPSHAATVAKICARLDGLPLAIELAAARVKVLSVDQIASRLDDRFRLLTGGSRTALPRQQTLQAAMDWSYELLSDRERAALRRLSVFAGGWSLEGAEAVGAGGGISKPEILRLLGQLVDKSLVNVEDQEPEVRYGLLDTVRQYGLRKLLEAGEAQGTRASHLAWCIELAEHAADHGVHGPDQRLWLARLEAEHDNLRAAMAWAREGGDTEAALRLARGLWWFWYLRATLGKDVSGRRRRWEDRAERRRASARRCWPGPASWRGPRATTCAPWRCVTKGSPCPARPTIRSALPTRSSSWGWWHTGRATSIGRRLSTARRSQRLEIWAITGSAR